MKHNDSKKLLLLASFALSAASAVFLCLSLLEYEKAWTLPTALGCVSLSLLLQIIYRQQSK